MDNFLVGRDECRKKIAQYLAYLTVLLDILNSNHLMDLNDTLEQTFCGLLNRVFGWNLINLNDDEKNFPGIDLSDCGNRISVQISSTGNANKVHKTLRTFFEKGLNAKYDSLYIFFLKDSLPTVTDYSADLRDGFSFNFQKHVWNSTLLFKRISSIEDVCRLKDIVSYLEGECGKFPTECRCDDMGGHLQPSPARPLFYICDSRSSLIQPQIACLKNEKILYLCGPGGIGKTQMARELGEVLRQKNTISENPYTIQYIPPQYPGEDAMQSSILNAQIDGICYIGSDPTQRKDAFDRRIQLLKNRYNGKCIILDDFYLPDKELNQLRNEESFRAFTAINAHLICTTRYDTSGWNVVRVPPLHEEVLMHRIRLHCNNELLTNDRLRPILQLIGCNSMIAYLVAETMRVGFCEPEELFEVLQSGNYSCVELPDITDDRTGRLAPICEHIYSLYDIYALDESARDVLSLAQFILEDGIDRSLFRNAISPEKKEWLKQLCNGSWIYQKDSRLFVNPVVKLVCRNRLKPAPDVLRNFLKDLWQQYFADDVSADHKEQISMFFKNVTDYFDEDEQMLRWYNEINVQT